MCRDGWRSISRAEMQPQAVLTSGAASPCLCVCNWGCLEKMVKINWLKVENNVLVSQSAKQATVN